MKTQNHIIPAPTGYRIVISCARLIKSVTLNDVTVIYDNDETAWIPRITISLAPADQGYCTEPLRTAIRTNNTIGHEMLHAEISCGGLLVDDVHITDTTTDMATIREALTYFYVTETDTDTRRALRSIYRYLTHVDNRPGNDPDQPTTPPLNANER